MGEEVKPEADWVASRVEAIEVIITKLEAQFNQEEFKGNIGDYVRLVQVRKDLAKDELKEVRVSWVAQ